MYTPASFRAANAYRQVGVQSAVTGASSHRLIQMLFEGLLDNLRRAHGAIERDDVEAKCKYVSHALRILGEGLKASLDRENGGELAANLSLVYDYCLKRLVLANIKSDAAGIQEVLNLLSPLAQSWQEIGSTPQARGE